MARIISEPAQTILVDADMFLIDNTSTGSHKISASDLKDAIVSNYTAPGAISAAGFHNSIYRGKNLGTSITAAQQAEIQNGTFNNLFIGDYWTINGRVYRIADFDPFYRCGDNINLGHHIALVPDAPMKSAQMHNTDTGGYIAGSEYNVIAGGYVASDMRTVNMASVITTVQNDLGTDNVLQYRDLLPTATNSSGDSSWGWQNCSVELMSETMVYGTKVWANSGYSVGCCCRQLSLFRLNPAMIHTRYTYWLRNASSAAGFCFVTALGSADYATASNARAVRPLVLYA